MLSDPMIDEDHFDHSASCHSNTGWKTPGCFNNVTNSLDSKTIRLPHGLFLTIFLGTLAVAVNLIAIFGNFTVLLAFILERKIRQPSNYFLASLALADLIIAVVSMPLYTVYILLGSWILGPWLCDIWLALDWSACVTSKYTVFFLAMDRFLGVTIPIKYRNWRTRKKILLMILIAWLVPVVIFFTAIIGWQHFVGERRVHEDECKVQFVGNTSFTLLLILGYFWIPLVFMCIFYAGIYRVALNLERRATMRCQHINTMRELAEPNPVASNLDVYNSGDYDSKSNNNSAGAYFFSQGQKSQQSGQSVMPYLVAFQTLHVKKQSAPLKSSRDDYNSTTATLRSGESNCLNGELGHLGGFSVCDFARAASGRPQRNTSSVAPSLLIDCNLASLTSAKFENLSRGFRRPSSFTSYDFKLARTSRNSKSCYSTTFGGSKKQSESFNTQQKRQSRILTDQKRPLTTLSWNNVAPNAVSTRSVITSSDMTGLYIAPIWKLHPFLSSLASGIFELENEVNHCPLTTKITIATGQPTASILPPCTAYVHSTHRQRLLEIKVKKGANLTTAAESDTDYTKGQSPAATVNTYCSSEHSQQRTISSSRVDPSTASIKPSQAPSGLLDDRRSSDGTNVHSSGRRGFWCFRQRRPPPENLLQNRTRKTLRTLTFILGAFILCWSPYSVVIIVLSFCRHCVSPTLYSFTYWLCYLNSPLNPFCYAFASPQYRVTFLRIMRLDWHRT